MSSTTNLLEAILSRLEQVRRQNPELRFGQLIAVIGSLAEDETGHSLWDVEDEDFVQALERFAADLARSEAGKAGSIAAPDRGGMAPVPVSPPSQPPRQVS